MTESMNPNVLSNIQVVEPTYLVELSDEELAVLLGAGKRYDDNLRRRLGLESLENRKMMAANLNVTLSGGLLRIDGTDQSDTVVIRQQDARTVIDSIDNSRNVRRTELTGSVNQIEFSGGQGDDLIAFRDVPPSVNINVIGGAGADLSVTEADSYFSELATASSANLVEGPHAAATESGVFVSESSDDEGNEFKVTYKDGRPVLAESWNVKGGYNRLSWNDDGSMERASFQNQELTQIEAWEGNDLYRRVVLTEQNTLVRELFVGDQLRIREQEGNGQLTRTAMNPDGSSLQQTFLNGKITLQETRSSDGTVLSNETLQKAIDSLNAQQVLDAASNEAALQNLTSWRREILSNQSLWQADKTGTLGSAFKAATDLRDSVTSQWTQWRETQTSLQNKALQTAITAQDKLASEWSAWRSTNVASWDKYVRDMQSWQTNTVNEWTTWRDNNVAAWNKYGSDMSNWKTSTVNSWTTWRDNNVRIQTDYMDRLQSWASSELGKIGLSLKSIGFGLAGVSVSSFSSAANTAISKGKDINASINDGVAQAGQLINGAVNSAAGKAKSIKDRANSIKKSLTDGLNSAKGVIADVVSRANSAINSANDKLRTAQALVSKEVNAIQTRANGVINDAKNGLSTAKQLHAKEIATIQSRAATEIQNGIDRLDITRNSVSKEIARIQSTAVSIINEASSKWNEAKSLFDQETEKVKNHASDVIKDAEDKWTIGKKVISDDIARIKSQLVDDVRKVTEKWEVMTDWATDRWEAFATTSVTKWHDTLEKLDAGWMKFEDQFRDYSVRQITQIAVEPLDGQYRILIAMNKSGALPTSIEWRVTLNGQLVHSEQTGLQNSLVFSATDIGKYRIQVNMQNAKREIDELASAGADIELPISEYTIIYGKKDPPADSNNSESSTNNHEISIKAWDISLAEQKRGFALPYVLASTGISMKEENGTVEYRQMFDMVEITEDTQVQVVYKKVNSQGKDVNVNGESEQAYNDRINKLNDLVNSFERFEKWIVKQDGRTWEESYNGEVTKRENENAYRKEWGDELLPPITTDKVAWMIEVNSHDYEFNFPGRVGTLSEAIRASMELPELRQQPWTREQFPVLLPGEDAIRNGAKIPDVVTNAQGNQQWGVEVTVLEAIGARPMSTPIADTLNSNLFNKVRAGGTSANKWVELRQRIQDASEVRLQASRDSEAIRGMRSVDVNRGIKEVFATTQKDAEELFSMAVPGFGFFMNLGNTYMYAKEGNVEGAVVEGSFALLEVLTSGVVGKAGRFVPNPFGKTSTNVVQLEPELVAKGSKAIADGLIAGAKKLETIVAQSRAAGYAPKHMQSISQFAHRAEHMLVLRAANAKSVQYHNVAGFKPKPGVIPLLPDAPQNSPLKDLKFLLKTDAETGLVKGTRAADGTLLDARGGVTEFVVSDVADANGWRAIHTSGPNGLETGLRLDREGFIVDFHGNRFFSDYDLMGVYEESTNAIGKFQPSTVGENIHSEFITKLNRAIDKDLQMVQHGANDAYWKVVANEVKHVNPAAGDLFMVVHPNAPVEFLDFAGLMELYRSLGIPLPIN